MAAVFSLFEYDTQIKTPVLFSILNLLLENSPRINRK
jgi:hypothetical protein